MCRIRNLELGEHGPGREVLNFNTDISYLDIKRPRGTHHLGTFVFLLVYLGCHALNLSGSLLVLARKHTRGVVINDSTD